MKSPELCKQSFLKLSFRLAKTMESLHIKLSGRYIKGTGSELSKMRRAGLGPVERPEMTPADPAETTENTVPEVVFDDETKYGWPDRIGMLHRLHFLS